ncbi:hypothetical protein [uncultured Roseobacter sp.]|uniref:hypothetical protein n=1 Tax=uncultured Roseobacter sp. TaxID=114847 RepID=UPI0026034E8B|nr:hypothetical protein [uncultured Roseobacter sp.]
MSEEKLTVVAASVEELRCPREEAKRAAIIRTWAETANLVRDRILMEIWNWQQIGGRVIPSPASNTAVDLDRMESLGEMHVYDVDRAKISVACHNENQILLVRSDDCFGENTRRTLNRHFEKIYDPSKRAVDRRLRSFMFWEDVAIKIKEKREKLEH